MDVELSIEEEDAGMNNSIQEEVKKYEGAASMDMLEDEMNSLDDEEIWRSRRKRMDKALAAAQTVVPHDPAEVYAAARKLMDVINGAEVEEFLSMIERLADQTHPSAIFGFLGLSKGSLLHIAAGVHKVDILRLLVDYVCDHLIAARDDWGNTPLHIAAKAGQFRAAVILIRRARNLPGLILRMKNKHGNTALHEAVLNHHVNIMRLLLREDLEPVYWKNADQKSPLYLALDTNDSMIHEVLFSLSLEPSKIQGLPPIHGAITRVKYDLITKILEKNIKLFAMTDSSGANVFHLAALWNWPRILELLRPENEYLAREQDMNGDLPIHMASKMGYVHLINKLHPVSHLLNRRGQTVLHVAAKYGRASAVKHILKHPELRLLINERDHAGNTPLHLAAIYSQPAVLIPLVLDERIDLLVLNHECFTAFAIALDRLTKDHTFRKLLVCVLLGSTSAIGIGKDLLVLRPELRDKALSIVYLPTHLLNRDNMNDVVNTRLLVATLLVTVTFGAGFAVPGGFNGSDTVPKADQGMATMVDKRMFQAFAVCNTTAMLCAMNSVVNLIFVQTKDFHRAMIAYRRSELTLTIAFPAMTAAFLFGVTLTVGKLPWLANIIFYLGLVFLLIISGSKLLQFCVFLPSRSRRTHLLICWIVLAYIYLGAVETYILDDSEEDGTASGTSASQPSDGAGETEIDDSKCGDAPHPPNH